jgi:hypothetical protein
VREEGVTNMISNFAVCGVAAAGMSWTVDAHIAAHPAHPAAAKAAAAPRKRSAAAAGTAVASVRGYH